MQVALTLWLALVSIPQEEDIEAKVAQELEALEEATKNHDANAVVETYGRLLDLFPKASERDQKEIAIDVAKGMSNTDERVHMASATALAQMGEPAVGLLLKALGSSMTDRYPNLKIQVLTSLGQIASPKAITSMVRALQDKSYNVIAAAARALGMYAKTKVQYRIQVTGELLKVYTSIHGQASDGRNTAAVEKFNTIRPAMDEALKALTGQGPLTAPDYWKWYNDNKRNPKAWGPDG